MNSSGKMIRNKILWLAAICAVAIVGLQVASRVWVKPTPSPDLVEFQAVWSNIRTNMASKDEYRIFAKSLLQALEETTITEAHRRVLSSAFTYGLIHAGGNQKDSLLELHRTFLFAKYGRQTNSDPIFIEVQSALETKVSFILAIAPTHPNVALAIHSIRPENVEGFIFRQQVAIEETMNHYLIENQSVLQITSILGLSILHLSTAIILLFFVLGLLLIHSKICKTAKPQ
ncbi:MAG TPA: hypothetical protein DCM62_10960 [Bacteroidales bacterium]|nr:hypothetical protein [Bacteroidales bacterium]